MNFFINKPLNENEKNINDFSKNPLINGKI